MYHFKDILSADLEERVENQKDQQNCICNGKSCICCVDFNMTYIDLGGPGELIDLIVIKKTYSSYTLLRMCTFELPIP